MQKIKFYLMILVFFIFPSFCLAADLDALKADFLQGNFRRVIFEGQSQASRIHIGNTDELNYILGLSYLKETQIASAQDCFRRITSNLNSKFNAQATLGLADSYLVAGQFQKAEDIYNKLIADDSNSSQKAALLYRLSQLESKRGNSAEANEYLSKLRRDFPLSPELRFGKGITTAVIPVNDAREYSVQAGFFMNINNANNLKDKLLAKDYPAYIENSGVGYRVKVGRFKTQKEALSLESRLSAEGFQTKICP